MTRHADDDFEEPPHLRLLRRLVTGLIIVLILGVLAIAAAIVTRVGFGVGEGGEDAAGRPVSAERFALPAGMDIVAVGRGAGTVLFVLRDSGGRERLYTFDERTGAAVGESAITRAN